MSDKVVLVPNGDAVYAVPVEVCEKYALHGDDLASAQSALNDDSDVEGQGYYQKRNSRGEVWVKKYNSPDYERAPWLD